MPCAGKLSLTFKLINHDYIVLETEIVLLLRQVFDVIQNTIYGYLPMYVPCQWLMKIEEIPRRMYLWVIK